MNVVVVVVMVVVVAMVVFAHVTISGPGRNIHFGHM